MNEAVDEGSDASKIVAAGYDRVASRYAELEQPGHEWPLMRWLRAMLSRLADGAEVLDVGCGNGLPATRAIAERHRATGVDVSSKQIELARRNVPAARLIHADVTSVQFPDASFDAIAAFYVVEHIPRERHAGLFARFWSWSRPGGYLLFTIEPDERPGIVGNWLDVPMFFSQFSADKTIELVEAAGFIVISRGFEGQTEGGRDVPYLWTLAQKTPTAAT